MKRSIHLFVFFLTFAFVLLNGCSIDVLKEDPGETMRVDETPIITNEENEVSKTVETNRSILTKKIDEIFDDPRFSNAFWGILVTNVDGQDVIYERNSGKSFMPASNDKLLTTAAAFHYLGEDYRFQTQILWRGELDREGTLDGDIIIRGAGDPSISGRYRKDDVTTTAILDQWVDSVKIMGIKKVKGEIIGDGSFFTDEMLESTWELEDFPNWYAACTTALAMNDNCLDFTVTPGEEPGDTANIEPWPTMSYMEVQNLVKTSATGSRANIDWWHYPAENKVQVSGSIPVDGRPVSRRTTIFDGNRYGAHLLKERLEANGIIIEGDAAGWTQTSSEGMKDKPEHLIFTHLSPPLSDIVAIINKPSQNFYADMLFRTLGGLVKNEGSFKAGGEAVSDFLTMVGAPEINKLQLRDGSGLSRRNLIQPRQMAAMLSFATRQTWFDAFYNSLPIAGVDGTLRGRMRNSPAENNVHAKTGTISNVRGLSGYVTTLDGERLIFATFGNHYTESHQNAGSLQDELCKLLASFNYSESNNPVATGDNN